MTRVLIVAFDGLDRQLIEEYGLENIRQDEFGKIDNTTGISTIVTTELFASFITGKTYECHGIIGLNRPESDFLNLIEFYNSNFWMKKFSGLRKGIYNEIPFIDGDYRKYTRYDLEASSIFDKINNSKAIEVPAYSLKKTDSFGSVLEKYGVEEATKELERVFEMKKSELFASMNNREDDLIMAHFHKPDHIHHWYWEVGKMDKVEETYYEMDEFAGEILEKAEENGFDTVIFMSDHGLPDVENGGHNENAFYSCNHELFGDETPHITDFHDKVLELVDQKDEEIEGIDV